jgi:hypothetical protein
MFVPMFGGLAPVTIRPRQRHRPDGRWDLPERACRAVAPGPNNCAGSQGAKPSKCSAERSTAPPISRQCSIASAAVSPDAAPKAARRHPLQHAVDGRAHGVVINGCGHQRGHGEQAPNKHRDEHHVGLAEVATIHSTVYSPRVPVGDGLRSRDRLEKAGPLAPQRLASNLLPNSGAVCAALRCELWQPIEGNLLRTLDIRRPRSWHTPSLRGSATGLCVTEADRA